MKLKEIYELAVSEGISVDSRGKDVVLKLLEDKKEDFKQLPEENKKKFDKEELKNPYNDTRILYGKLDKEIKNIFVGIDIGLGELLLVDKLRQNGQHIDLVISHHPTGIAIPVFPYIVKMQADYLASFGVPINIAEYLVSEQISQVNLSLAPLNYNRDVDGARLLDIPFMCIHTPADNLVQNFICNLIEKQKPQRLKELLKLLESIDEHKYIAQHHAYPQIIMGNEDNKVGKIMVDMSGGMDLGNNLYEQLSSAGVNTIVIMSIEESHYKEAGKYHFNMIMTNHMATDSLGMNLLLDKIEKTGVEIIAGSGFIRIKRGK